MTHADRKFALLVLPVSPDDGQEIDFAPGRSWRARVADLVDEKQIAHWQTWLGSVAWEKMIEHEHRLVLLTMPTERAEVLDAENADLSSEMHLMWRALLLAAPLQPFSGEGWLLTGAIDAAEARLLKINELATLGPIVRPFWASRKVFWARLPWREGDDWRSRWSAIVTHLRAVQAGLPDAIRLALLSYEEGHRQLEIEFRIPTFVRAAEAVLAIPRGRGGPLFSERMLKVAPHLTTHWSHGVQDLATKMIALYQHRNDCVHGKVPFLLLKSQGEAGADEAAWFECLAEATAREALLFALHSPALLAAATDRAALEAAWAAGTVP